jgi:hypothetical protein
LGYLFGHTVISLFFFFFSSSFGNFGD